MPLAQSIDDPRDGRTRVVAVLRARLKPRWTWRVVGFLHPVEVNALQPASLQDPTPSADGHRFRPGSVTSRTRLAAARGPAHPGRKLRAEHSASAGGSQRTATAARLLGQRLCWQSREGGRFHRVSLPPGLGGLFGRQPHQGSSPGGEGTYIITPPAHEGTGLN